MKVIVHNSRRHAVFSNGGKYSVCVLERCRQRLFAQEGHVSSSCCQACCGVVHVGNCDVDRINEIGIKQVTQALKPGRLGDVELCTKQVPAYFGGIDDGSHRPGIVHTKQGRYMALFHDSTTADETKFQGLHAYRFGLLRSNPK